jgi:hypothetical protein
VPAGDYVLDVLVAEGVGFHKGEEIWRLRVGFHRVWVIRIGLVLEIG